MPAPSFGIRRSNRHFGRLAMTAQYSDVLAHIRAWIRDRAGQRPTLQNIDFEND